MPTLQETRFSHGRKIVISFLSIGFIPMIVVTAVRTVLILLSEQCLTSSSPAAVAVIALSIVLSYVMPAGYLIMALLGIADMVNGRIRRGCRIAVTTIGVTAAIVFLLVGGLTWWTCVIGLAVISSVTTGDGGIHDCSISGDISSDHVAFIALIVTDFFCCFGMIVCCAALLFYWPYSRPTYTAVEPDDDQNVLVQTPY